MAILFENETCGRCGGSGRYSYCSMHGSTCFGCGGAGRRLTKRGRAAQLYLQALRERPVTELKVGDLVLIDGIPGMTKSRFGKITEIQTGPGRDFGYPVQGADSLAHRIVTTAGTLIGFENCKYRKGFTAEEKQAQVAQALEYQATLTKTGKPKKIKGGKHEAETGNQMDRSLQAH